MKRRDFLRLTGTAAIAGLTRVVHAAPWIKPESDLILSVAHAEEWESGVLRDVRVLSGDGAFAGRSTAVRIFEIRGPQRMHVDAIYSIDGVDVRVQAATNGSVPMRFTMPGDVLRFEVNGIPLRFSMHSLEDTVALRRGRYVVVMHERTSPPSWPSLRVEEDHIEGNVAGGIMLMSFE